MLSGPITIAQYSADSTLTGAFAIYVYACIAEYKRWFNQSYFPYPALDGGHLLQYLIEFIIRKPIQANIIIACLNDLG